MYYIQKPLKEKMGLLPFFHPRGERIVREEKYFIRDGRRERDLEDATDAAFGSANSEIPSFTSFAAVDSPSGMSEAARGAEAAKFDRHG